MRGTIESENLKFMERCYIMIEADIKAKIVLTGRDSIKSGYRPAHLIGDYLTTGLHQYIGTNTLNKGEMVEGYITFVSPEYYPNSLAIGDKLEFYEGSKLVGYIYIIEIYNELLKSK